MQLSNAESRELEIEVEPMTRDLLVESALLMDKWSKSKCASKDAGGMEEWAKNQKAAPREHVHTCDWYHGTWQYLRLLNMVATPPWYGFYNETLSGILRNNPNAEVLISAAADYGMLQTLHEAIETAGVKPSIVIYDICETPLEACRWYANRVGLEIKCVCRDLLTGTLPEAPFDLIVTDEFLTVLKNDSKPMIVERWRELLKPGGCVVTTAMIGEPTTPGRRQYYARRARTLFEQNTHRFPHHLDGAREALTRSFDTFAEFHTRHMIIDEEQIHGLFSVFDEFTCSRITTPGECVNPTDSFQIVASRTT